MNFLDINHFFVMFIIVFLFFAATWHFDNE